MNWLQDFMARWRNQFRTLTLSQRRLLMMGVALLVGTVLMWAGWICLIRFRAVDGLWPYIVGNFPHVAQDEQWLAFQKMRGVVTVISLIFVFLGVILWIAAPLAYWFYREDEGSKRRDTELMQ